MDIRLLTKAGLAGVVVVGGRGEGANSEIIGCMCIHVCSVNIV